MSSYPHKTHNSINSSNSSPSAPIYTGLGTRVSTRGSNGSISSCTFSLSNRLSDIRNDLYCEDTDRIRSAVKSGADDTVSLMESVLTRVILPKGLCLVELDYTPEVDPTGRLPGRLRRIPHTVACWRNPRGDRLRVLVSVDPGLDADAGWEVARDYLQRILPVSLVHPGLPLGEFTLSYDPQCWMREGRVQHVGEQSPARPKPEPGPDHFWGDDDPLVHQSSPDSGPRPDSLSQKDEQLGGQPSPRCERREVDVDTAVNFLRRMFAPKKEQDELAGHLLIWTSDPLRPDKISHWYKSLSEVQSDLEANRSLWAGLEVYFGVSLSEPGLKKGKDLTQYRRLKARGDENNPGAWFQPGMWADLDYGQTGHKDNGKNYAPDSQTVLQRIRSMPVQPTIIVESGHGLQTHWLFEGPMEIGEDTDAASQRSQAWNDEVRELMTPSAVDSTWDLARLMRLPGTWNNKISDSPKQVRIIDDVGPVTTTAEIDRILAERTLQASYSMELPKNQDRGKQRGRPGATASASGSLSELEVKVNPMRLLASVENCPDFRKTWEGNRPDLPDQSQSAVDMALANQAVMLEWPQHEIPGLIVCRRKNAHRRDGRISLKYLAYYSVTAQKAIDWWDEKQAHQQEGQTQQLEDKEPSAQESQNTGRKPTAVQKQQEDGVNRAIHALISGIRDGEKAIHWLAKFFELRENVWVQQDDLYFKRLIQKELARARREMVSTAKDIVVNSYMNSLRDALIPRCVDTALLPVAYRYKNFNLDTGALVEGTSFRNGVVLVNDDGQVAVRPPNRREFFTGTRPYRFPESDPGRPVAFDHWLQERIPDPDTRQGMWEAIGGTILQKLTLDELMVVMVGPGGTGKGTLLRTVAVLVGGPGLPRVFPVLHPAGLVASQFSLSELAAATMVYMGDMPRIPDRGSVREALILGMGVIKNIVGQDNVPIEGKYRKQQSEASVSASVWIGTNFSLAPLFEDDDRDSWKRRILAFPMEKKLVARQQPRYEKNFVPEVDKIAWHAVNAYAATRQNGFTVSTEMRTLVARMLSSEGADVSGFTETLVMDADARTTREELRAGFAKYLHAADHEGPAPTPSKKALTDLYASLKNTIGVEERKVRGNFEFRGVRLPQEDPQ